MSWAGFKKNVTRATTQVMMKTGAYSRHLTSEPIAAILIYAVKGMWRGQMIGIMKSRRGKSHASCPGIQWLTAPQEIQDYGISGE